MTKLIRPGPPQPAKAKGMVHELIAKTAKEMAEAVYEDCASDNDFYARWPNLRAFVAARWQSFVQPARENLAEMLGKPDSQVPPDQKAIIHEALIKNAAVNPAINQLH